MGVDIVGLFMGGVGWLCAALLSLFAIVLFVWSLREPNTERAIRLYLFAVVTAAIAIIVVQCVLMGCYNPPNYPY